MPVSIFGVRISIAHAFNRFGPAEVKSRFPRDISGIVASSVNLFSCSVCPSVSIIVLKAAFTFFASAGRLVSFGSAPWIQATPIHLVLSSSGECNQMPLLRRKSSIAFLISSAVLED